MKKQLLTTALALILTTSLFSNEKIDLALEQHDDIIKALIEDKATKKELWKLESKQENTEKILKADSLKITQLEKTIALLKKEIHNIQIVDTPNSESNYIGKYDSKFKKYLKNRQIKK